MHHELFKSKPIMANSIQKRNLTKNFHHDNIKEDEEEDNEDIVDDVSKFERGMPLETDFVTNSTSLRRRIGSSRMLGKAHILSRSSESLKRSTDDEMHTVKQRKIINNDMLQKRPIRNHKFKKIVFNGTFPIDDPYSSRFDDEDNY